MNFYVIIYIANNELNFKYDIKMSRVCFFCGKSVAFGGHRKHKYGGGWAYRAQRTPRKFKPNMRKIRIEKNGKTKIVDICMKCYKKMRKKDSNL